VDDRWVQTLIFFLRREKWCGGESGYVVLPIPAFFFLISLFLLLLSWKRSRQHYFNSIALVFLFVGKRNSTVATRKLFINIMKINLYIVNDVVTYKHTRF
jgi:hypothetical protein